MNRKLRALLERINGLKAEVTALAEAGKLDEAEAKKKELVAAQKEFDILKDVLDEDAQVFANMANAYISGDSITMGTTTATVARAGVGMAPVAAAEAETKDPVHAFAEAARHGFRNSANEGTAADGGYTVPEDIQTKINTYRDATFSLRQLVRVENVSTLSGARTYMTKAKNAAFTKVGEQSAIGQGKDMQFERITYNIKKYGGWFPVTNELLADSDANITGALTRWIGQGAQATDNANILEVLQKKTPTAITSLDEIKTAVNKTLGQAYKATSAIVTNDSGLDMLDRLKDINNRYLLTESISSPGKMRLSFGSFTLPVHVIPNEVLADDETNGTPFFVGDLKEAVTLFDRQRTSITMSDVAVAGNFNAFEQDMTLFKALLRQDAEMVDEDAFVYLTAAADLTVGATA